MTLVPKMHLTGGGQIVNIKSHSSSVHALIECRKDYFELAQNLLVNEPSASNFSLSIIEMLLPTTYDRADQVIEAIMNRRPVTRFSADTSKSNIFAKVADLVKRGVGISSA